MFWNKLCHFSTLKAAEITPENRPSTESNEPLKSEAIKSNAKSKDIPKPPKKLQLPDWDPNPAMRPSYPHHDDTRAWPKELRSDLSLLDTVTDYLQRKALEQRKPSLYIDQSIDGSVWHDIYPTVTVISDENVHQYLKTAKAESPPVDRAAMKHFFEGEDRKTIKRLSKESLFGPNLWDRVTDWKSDFWEPMRKPRHILTAIGLTINVYGFSLWFRGALQVRSKTYLMSF